jgi:predicted RNA-binding protein with PUA-like domain
VTKTAEEPEVEDTQPKKRGRAATKIINKDADDEPSKKPTRGKAVKSAAEPAPKTTTRGKRTMNAKAQPEVAKEAPKRGRGRAKATVEEAAEEEPAPKRGRGRAKKEVPAEPETVEDAPAAPAPKRGRGRAKKEEPTEEPTEAPAPRGRRGKTAEDVVPATKTKAPAKKRGRPAAVTATDPEDTAAEPPKKKRGRPSKADQLAEEQITLPDATTPSKKKRGRPSKADLEAAEDIIAAQNGTAAPTKSEEQRLQADALLDIIPKRRGRPSKATTELSEMTPKRESGGATPATAPARAGIPRDTPGSVVRRPGRPPKSAATSAASTPRPRGRPRLSAVSNAATATPRSTPGSARKERPPERRPSTEPEGFEEARPSKRVRRESTNEDEATQATPPAASKSGRRQTIAARATKTPVSKRSIPVPGTAPAKAAGRPGRKPKASLPLEPEEDDILAEDAAEPTEMIVESEALEETATSAAVEDASTEKLVTPKPRKSSMKPPKTAPAKGLLKGSKTSKRVRVSSPGPAPRGAKKARVDDNLAIPADDTGPAFWLLKAEPDSRIENGKDVKFSIDDLKNAVEPEPWTGVRNYGARNNMMAMKLGDLGFFYHSNTKVPGVVGILEVVQEATVDESAFDKNDPYYDEKSSREKPKWFNVHVGFKQKFDHPERTTLAVLREHSQHGEALEGMMLFRQTRLSVIKVSRKEWNYILDLAGHPEHKVEIEEPDVSMIDSTTMSVDQQIQNEIAAEPAPKPELTNANATAEFLEEVIEDVAERVAEQIAEDLEDANDPTSLEAQEEIAEEVADQLIEQLAEAIEDDMTGNGADDVATTTEVTAQVQYGMCMQLYIKII